MPNNLGAQNSYQLRKPQTTQRPREDAKPKQKSKMRNETYETLGGHKINISIPTTVEEYNSMANRGNAVLDDAIDHEVYHGTLGEVRDTFVKLVEEKTSIPRREIGTGKFTGEGDKKKELTKKETPGDYYKRVCAEKGLDPEVENFPEIAASISAGGEKEVKFNPAVVRKAAGPKKLPADYLNLAKQAIEQDAVKAISKTFQKELGKPWSVDENLKGDELATAIGWAMREIKLSRDKKAGLGSFLKAQ